MATFDAPSRENCTLRRIHTNTPLQAFVTLNDPVFVEAAQALGRRMAGLPAAKLEEKVREGFFLCLGRPPEKREIQTLVELYQSQLEHFSKQTKEAEELATKPLGQLPEKLAAPEAAAWTAVANVLLNLDGVLTKG
jgi:hypothetical protein